MQFDVKIRKVIENGKPLKALASVTVDGSFTIHNVRVIKTENAQFVAMPYATFKDADGKDVRRDIVHPIKSEVRKAMETLCLQVIRILLSLIPSANMLRL